MVAPKHGVLMYLRVCETFDRQRQSGSREARTTPKPKFAPGQDYDVSISNTIEYLPIDQLNLDPRNPRLRENQHGLSQAQLLEVMTDWELEEIAASIAESGFWPNEALIVVNEKLTQKATKKSPIVVEGNRRLAAVRMLLAAKQSPAQSSAKWKGFARDLNAAAVARLKKLPVIMADERSDVAAFLGFRHVTGIKQWEPHEKAAFIAQLIDGGLSYEEVMRRIGSKTQTVRQNYIAFKLFHQMEDLEGVDVEKVRKKFSVLFLSLRATGTQDYLGIEIDAEPEKAKKPLQPKYRANAVRFAKWLFGDKKNEPLFTDSRHVDKFGLILGHKDAVAYLERTDRPRFEIAVRKSGGDAIEVVRHLERASDEIEEVLSIVQHHSGNTDVREAWKRLARDVSTLQHYFTELSADDE